MSNKELILSKVFCGLSLALMISTRLMAQVTPIPTPEFMPMESNVTLGASTVLVQKSFTLQAGEKRRVFGRAEIGSSVTSTIYVETYTLCVGPDGTQSQRGGAAQNHQGKDTPIGPGYPFPGELALYPLLLFQAPTTGTYTCELLAKGDSRMSAVARDYDGFSTTWLQVSSADDTGASWWQNLDCDEYGDYGPATATRPASWCLYLAGASNVKQLYVFDNDGSPAKVWDAPGEAAFVDASDSLMLTTCHYATSSCTSNNSQSWSSYYLWDIGSDGTVVNSHVELIQLNSAQGVCKITESPEQRTWVGNDPHHYMIYHSLSAVPVYPECGSRQFKLRISVSYVSGNPVKIDGYLWTHAYAFKSYSGSPRPVPNLAGLTEGVASSYVTATGYAVSSISSILNAAPAGTVLSQSPAAGAIELPGSPVSFTVSTGGVDVPNLLSRAQSSATSAITALGLVPSVSFSKECINLGEVMTQSPLAGTLVSPGSAVHITVDSGTRQSCGVLK
jgi:hypothetical protein